MMEERLSHSETCRRFEVNSRDQIKSWERIYLEEGPERLDGRTARQRLRAENDYLKLTSLGFGRRATPAQKVQVVQKAEGKDIL